MTQYFHSGTAKNGAFQWLENKCTDYRLFSTYGDYRKPVMRWLRDAKDASLAIVSRPLRLTAPEVAH